MSFNENVKITFNESLGKLEVKCKIYQNGLVKKIPNRRWNSLRNCWLVPVIRSNCSYILGSLSEGVKLEICGKAREAMELKLQGCVLRKDPFPKNFKFKTKPYGYQMEALNCMGTSENFALFMEMGTGKTKVTIDKVKMHWDKGDINRVLIACPLAVCSTWKSEIEKHCFGEPLVEVASKKSEKFLKSDHPFKILIVGIESMSVKERGGTVFDVADSFVGKMGCGMVVDESHLLKNHQSNRTVNCFILGRRCEIRMILTGTPMTQSPMDLYSQFQFLSPDIIGIGDYYSFKARYAEMGGFKDKAIVGYNNLDELTDLISPYSFQCTKEDCLDLPDKVYEVREIELSKEQKSMYNSVKKDKVLSIPVKGSETLIAENVLVAYTMLQQIIGGFVAHSSLSNEKSPKTVRDIHTILPPSKNPKIKEIFQIIEEDRSKSIIIWAKYKEEIKVISSEINKKYGEGSAVTFFGELSRDEMEENKDKFLRGEAKYFVANAQIGGTGLTLNVAHRVIYYSNTFKCGERMQSEDRCHRIGQTNKVTYIDLVAKGTVDEVVMRALKDKKDLSDFVLQYINKGGDINAL